MLYWIDVGERLWHWGWRDDVEQAGGGWSMDGGVHFADLFRYHIGEVDELYAVSKAYCPTRYQNHEAMEGPIPATVEDTTVAVLHFKNGVIGQWTSTNAAPGARFSNRAIYGESGSIKWGEGLTTRTENLTMGDLVQEFIGSISAEEKERMFPRGVTDTVATELKEFIDAVATGSPVEITGLEGYKDEALSLALYESSELNAPVKIDQIESLEIENYQSRFNQMIGLK
jgi:predicted dehydrogenase